MKSPLVDCGFDGDVGAVEGGVGGGTVISEALSPRHSTYYQQLQLYVYQFLFFSFRRLLRVRPSNKASLCLDKADQAPPSTATTRPSRAAEIRVI